jgi:hypothetical protein
MQELDYLLDKLEHFEDLRNLRETVEELKYFLAEEKKKSRELENSLACEISKRKTETSELFKVKEKIKIIFSELVKDRDNQDYMDKATIALAMLAEVSTTNKNEIKTYN